MWWAAGIAIIGGDKLVNLAVHAAVAPPRSDSLRGRRSLAVPSESFVQLQPLVDPQLSQT